MDRGGRFDRGRDIGGFAFVFHGSPEQVVPKEAYSMILNQSLEKRRPIGRFSNVKSSLANLINQFPISSFYRDLSDSDWFQSKLSRA
jgi:hypothetical protein